MDYLRDGIHLRQVAQQDPLTAWQKEGYVMFEHLLDRMPDLAQSGPAERLRSNFINGIKHLPVSFTPGPRILS